MFTEHNGYVSPENQVLIIFIFQICQNKILSRIVPQGEGGLELRQNFWTAMYRISKDFYKKKSPYYRKFWKTGDLDRRLFSGKLLGLIILICGAKYLNKCR